APSPLLRTATMTLLKTPRPRQRRKRADRPFPSWFRSRPRLEGMEDRTLLSSFLVSTTADSGPGSLRQAILDSNAATGPNAINFDIPGTGLRIISLLSAMPTIATPVVIDGYSQPGASPNTEAQSDNAVLQVFLD